MEAVVIPEGVGELMGFQFLDSCCSLKTVDLPSTLTKVHGAEFCWKCTALETVTCRATTPPEFIETSDAFEGVPLSNVTLKVPAAGVAAYQAADVWKNFDIEGY